MTKVIVNLPGREYPIIIGERVLQTQAARLAELCPDKKAAVVTDENVYRRHGAFFEKLLCELGLAALTVRVPAGEQSKSFGELERLCREFARFGLSRRDPVIAFGGGVVGDLAGFAAASYMRGVPFVQIPTTLLAHVDSSVGGKVAVNLPEGKNLAGSFYQPALVLSDTSLLSTLPRREALSGMAEVIKYAAIGETELMGALSVPGDISGEYGNIIEHCVRRKAGYAERDERDTGERMLLNFGHTFGHAIEKTGNFEKYTHGEAVALGMGLAVQTGIRLGLTEPAAQDTLETLCRARGINLRYDGDIKALIPLLLGDKKTSGARITLILLRKFGEAFAYAANEDELLKIW
jgi:3-dehydroquinate synthase